MYGHASTMTWLKVKEQLLGVHSPLLPLCGWVELRPRGLQSLHTSAISVSHRPLGLYILTRTPPPHTLVKNSALPSYDSAFLVKAKGHSPQSMEELEPNLTCKYWLPPA